MKKLILLFLIVVLFTGCSRREVAYAKNSSDYCVEQFCLTSPAKGEWEEPSKSEDHVAFMGIYRTNELGEYLRYIVEVATYYTDKEDYSEGYNVDVDKLIAGDKKEWDRFIEEGRNPTIKRQQREKNSSLQKVLLHKKIGNLHCLNAITLNVSGPTPGSEYGWARGVDYSNFHICPVKTKTGYKKIGFIYDIRLEHSAYYIKLPIDSPAYPKPNMEKIEAFFRNTAMSVFKSTVVNDKDYIFYDDGIDPYPNGQPF